MINELKQSWGVALNLDHSLLYKKYNIEKIIKKLLGI